MSTLVSFLPISYLSWKRNRIHTLYEMATISSTRPISLYFKYFLHHFTTLDFSSLFSTREVKEKNNNEDASWNLKNVMLYN
jgi:hypothetical protein